MPTLFLCLHSTVKVGVKRPMRGSTAFPNGCYFPITAPAAMLASRQNFQCYSSWKQHIWITTFDLVLVKYGCYNFHINRLDIKISAGYLNCSSIFANTCSRGVSAPLLWTAGTSSCRHLLGTLIILATSSGFQIRISKSAGYCNSFL